VAVVYLEIWIGCVWRNGGCVWWKFGDSVNVNNYVNVELCLIMLCGNSMQLDFSESHYRHLSSCCL